MTETIPNGYIKTKAGVIPDDWDSVTLSDVAIRISSGGTPSRKISHFWVGETPWITGADITDQNISIIRRKISNDAIKNSSTQVFPKGSLLIVTRTGIGKMAIAPFDIAVSQDITGVTFSDYSDANYTFWAFNKQIDKLIQLNQGTSINGITRSDLLGIQFPLPPEREKLAITNIFNTLEEAIVTTEAIIACTEELKRGFMQVLLTRGIDEDGKIRSEETHAFKDSPIGRVPVEWDVNRLSELSEVRTGPFGSLLHEKDYAKFGTPIITVEHLGEISILHKNLPLVSDEDKNRLSKYILFEGDVVFSRVGSVDRNCLVSDKEDGWLFSGRLLRVRPDKMKINPKYLSLYLNTHSMRKHICNISVGGTMPSLNTKLLNSVPISCPNITEQNRIVSILWQFEEEIESESESLIFLKTLKRGLMQDLLTGRVRVPEEMRQEAPSSGSIGEAP